MKWLRQIQALFQPPTAEVLMVRHLEVAKRMLLLAHAHREEAEALVQKYTARIARLKEALRTTHTAGSTD
jgi:hypothetical protein